MSRGGLDLVLLGKIWALAIGGTGGEATAAREQARRLVEKHGRTLADVPGLLGAKQPAASTPGSLFEGFEDWIESREPGYKARRAQERAEQQRQDRDELAALIKRYGSADAISDPTPAEAALRAAVLPWCVFQKPPADTRWVASIDGTSNPYLTKEMTPRVRQALSDAIPLPQTIVAAAIEHEAWQTRDRECGLAFGSTEDVQLDLPAWYRWEIVRELLETGLRATCLDDVLTRQRYAAASDTARREIEKAVLLDLEHLAALAVHAGVQYGQSEGVQTGQAQGYTGKPVADPEWTTATARRERVRSMLSNVDMAGLSDREIARRAGVSPQTVGNIRRRVAG